jgi:hypothetical protein
LRSERSARSNSVEAGSAATEFARYTAPNAFSRRHTAARNRVGSLGTRYTNTSHETRSATANRLTTPRNLVSHVDTLCALR